jgi:two-component system, OmpR family, response regulator
MNEPFPSDNNSKIVIGVDDSADNLSLLERIAVNAGYAFFGAASGAASITLTARVVPQLILLDIQMPDMDGFETCRQLRGDRRLSQVPIAFLTARQSVADVRTGMAVGGNDFIVKPFDHEKLVERMHHWTRRRVNTGW